MIELFLALSYHFLPGDWNEIHPGIRYRQDELVAGVYHNSENGASVFAAYDFGSIELGLVTGYSGMDVMPFLRATYELSGATLFVSPVVNTDRNVGVVIGIEVPLGRF